MSTNDATLANVYQSLPTDMNSDNPAMKKMEDIRDQSIDHMLYAAAQDLAMARIKVFNSMAKAVSDLQ